MDENSSGGMAACMQKLALWCTRTFRPLTTHDDLEPIMSTLGFVQSPSTVGVSILWKEYLYSAAGGGGAVEPPPRPRLPYPRIDGLHVCTYKAFLDAVNLWLNISNISDTFHIRGMPLQYLHDSGRRWSRIEEDGGNFVYREGTLDRTVVVSDYYCCQRNSMNTIIRSRGKDTPTFTIAPLNDIIVRS